MTSIADALRRISQVSAELQKAEPRKMRGLCHTLYRDVRHILSEVERAQKGLRGPPVQDYGTAMRFLREALAIRYDQGYYRHPDCTDRAVVHACWLELGQLQASGAIDAPTTMRENGHSFGKALGPAAQKAMGVACAHVLEVGPPRTPARMVIEDGRAIKNGGVIKPDMTNVVLLSRRPA